MYSSAFGCLLAGLCKSYSTDFHKVWCKYGTYVTPLLRDLHWLRVPERIEFKLAVLVFRCLHGTVTAPAHI